MSRKVLSALVAACAALVFSSCSEQASDYSRLRFVTGGEAGTYYAFGSVIAQHASNNTGVQVVGLAGKGSQGNIMDLQDRVAGWSSGGPAKGVATVLAYRTQEEDDEILWKDRIKAIDKADNWGDFN